MPCGTSLIILIFFAESPVQLRKAVFTAYAPYVCKAVHAARYPCWKNAGDSTNCRIHKWFVVCWIFRSFAWQNIPRIDLRMRLTEGRTQQLVLYLKFTVPPSAASAVNAPPTATFPANHTNTIAANLRSSPCFPASPSAREESGSIWSYDSSDRIASRRSSLHFYTNSPIVANEELSSGWLTDSTDRVMANPSSSPHLAANPIPVNEESSSSSPSNPNDRTPNPRSNPRYGANPTIALSEESSPGWPSNPTGRIANPRSSPRFSANPIPVKGESRSRWFSNLTGRITANPRSSSRLAANPIAVNEGSSSGWPSNSTDRTAVNPRSSPRPSTNPASTMGLRSRSGPSLTSNLVPSLPTNHTDTIASLGPRQPGPSTSIIPEFEPDLDDIIQTVQRWVHQSETVSFLLT